MPPNYSGTGTVQDALTALRSGKCLKVMCLGDSLVAGTSNYAGWREPLKRILLDFGISIDYVGSKTNQNGSMDTWFGGDYAHEGVGGDKISDMDARAAAAVAAAAPDLVIVGHFSNNYAQTTRATTMSGLLTLFNTLRSTPGYESLPIIVCGPTPYSSSGSLYVDSNITAVHHGVRDAVREASNVEFVDMQAGLAPHFDVTGFISGDTVHQLNQGYAEYAAVIARFLIGPLAAAISVKADSAYAYVHGMRRRVKVAFGNALNGTDQPLVTAVSNRKICVLGFVATSDTANTTVTFNTKPVGAGTAISQVFTALARTAIQVLPPTQTPLFKTNEGEGLTVTTGSATSITVFYVEL